MRRRLKQILLPIIIVVVGGILLMSLAFARLTQQHRAAANQEVAALVGAAAAENPDLDAVELIRALRSGSQTELGQKILTQYGYTASDLAAPSSTQLTHQAWLVLLGVILLLGIVFVGYFWWLDYRRERRVGQLVVYLQDLSDRLYDLQLDDNQDDELSLLSNELYKITVVLKEAAENSRQSQRNLETALADISHQLRTPLTSLQVMVDNIYDNPDMPASTRQDFLRSISRQIDAMSSLVMVLLNLAKFDNGSIKLQQLPVQVGELCAKVRQNLEILAEVHDVTLEFAGDLQAKVMLDLKWQAEALTNIVKNCIEHSPAGSKVIITAEDCPLFLRLTIQDFGEGIAPSDLRHIFERFYRATNATPGSIGIGLAFARAIIEAGGGQVTAESTLGQGTKFTITYFK